MASSMERLLRASSTEAYRCSIDRDCEQNRAPGEGVPAFRRSWRPQLSAVSFDDPAGEREREAKSATLFVELSGFSGIRRLDARFLGDDDHGATDAINSVEPAFGDHSGGPGMLAEHG